jgi:ethanolamine utilization protein EutQ (cupin superfamily)
MKKWTHLEVFAVGDQVTDIKAGDVVYLPKTALEQSDILEVEGEIKLMTSDFQIAIVW